MESSSMEQDMGEDSQPNYGVDRRNLLKASAIGLTAGFAGCLGNDEEGNSGSLQDTDELPEESITIGHPDPEDLMSPTPRSAEDFKRYVEYHSDGQFEVEIVPAGGLGSHGEMIEQVLTGQLEITYGAEGHISGFFPDIDVVSVPYAFRDVEHAFAVLDGEFGHRLRSMFAEETDAQVIGWWDNGGFDSFTTTDQPIEGPDDLEGLNIRIQEITSHQVLVEELGANPEIISWGELYEALDQGVVDGQKNSIPTTIAGNLHEVQSHMIHDQHMLSMTWMMASQSWFDELPEVYKRLVSEAGVVASYGARRNNRLVRSRGEQILADNGVELHVPSQDVIAEFRDRTQEPVQQVIEDELDTPELLDEMFNAIDQAEEELQY